MRYGAKVDAMHGPIRDGLRARGVFVLDLARAGKGCPDLFAFTQWTGWVPMEVKSRRTDYKAKKVQGLTDDQKKLHAQAPIHVVETLDAALEILGMGR